ncbi:MBL fold metallo-hydrolase [Tanticharoenia sakaeratensis]|uniref:Zn-dependent hydrolase n=1 Tax=Tanticharoenia sakaeratensis NBRC 103193 TaxID=1231623 RepID=A0A0D6MGJ0_9PROT|nr:MBL fold metallo-hydrolase [Tanticharoenia sakaeratensis]GAN52737.1 Zn-dependent hydrolase [Tanticharoenia sakaeratensis NBRC 103193]GBQ17873.1 metallo-beta-lactamase [Tanticharoenia sakaeratensis NBRC 103193]
MTGSQIQAVPGLAPDVAAFWVADSGSVQYVVSCPETRDCVVVDPVLDYDEKSGAIAHHSADRLLAHIAKNNLRLVRILDTHPHADHLSAAAYLHEKTSAPTAIGARVVEVQKLWREIYDIPDFPVDGRQWDHLFADDETFTIGKLSGRIMLSAGHTLCSITYVIGDAAFIHDTLFMPDTGAARADFPGGDAGVLYDSIAAIMALPDDTRLFTGHDYRHGGRDPAWETTVAQQRRENPWTTYDRASFIEHRHARDAALPMPRLILHALQVNINAGNLPVSDAKGRRFLKIPLNALGPHPDS